MIYAHLDGNTLLGWYDSNIHDTIPEPNIEVSQETWLEAVQSSANWYENGVFTREDLREQSERETEEAERIRRERNRLLLEADALVNLKEDLGEDAVPARTYRQALRDVPSQTGFPLDVTWPTKPEGN